MAVSNLLSISVWYYLVVRVNVRPRIKERCGVGVVGRVLQRVHLLHHAEKALVPAFFWKWVFACFHAPSILLVCTEISCPVATFWWNDRSQNHLVNSTRSIRCCISWSLVQRASEWLVSVSCLSCLSRGTVARCSCLSRPFHSPKHVDSSGDSLYSTLPCKQWLVNLYYAM